MKKSIFLYLILMFIFISCPKDEEIHVKSIGFEYDHIEMDIGEIKAIKFRIEPEERINDAEFDFSFSDGNTDVVKVTNITQSGFVLSALKRGTTVMMATCEGITCYMEIVVNGAEFQVEPYITVDPMVYEIEVGERKQINAGLYGGKPEDRSLFRWSSSNEDSVKVYGADSGAIIEACGSGFSQIEIQNERAKYPAKIMVFVNKEKEKTTYITTKENVVKMSLRGGTENITVNLMNSENNDLSLFSYECDDNEGKIVSINSNNNVCSVTPEGEGSAEIKITHPESNNILYIQAVVYDDTVKTYIDSDRNFIVMNKGGREGFSCFLNEGEIKDDFGYTISEEGKINVIQTGNYFLVEGLECGRYTVSITNPKADLPYEVYIVVEENEMQPYYITTTQNIIKTEVNAEPTELKMYLPNGNESDLNNFEWEVEDETVINVISPHGKVTSRSTEGEVINSMTEAVALIFPLRSGTSEIRVKNPKAECDSKVKVIVYPEGTFSSVPGVLKGTGLVKIEKGKSESHEIEVISGDVNINSILWNIEDESKATVSGNGLKGIVTGKGSGITELSVSGEGISYPYNATVVSGTKEEIENYRAIYTENQYVEIYKGDTGFIEIKSTAYINGEYHASVNDRETAECYMSGNMLIVKGKKGGKTEIVVNNEDAENTLVLIVNVMEELSLKYPYYFTNEKYVGVVNGKYKDVDVILNNAPENEKSIITWRVEDEEICKAEGNGEKCRVRAVKSGITKIYAHSDRAENDAVIIVYTADTEEELESKIIMKAEKMNYLCEKGESLYIHVDINNREENFEWITWDSDDLSIVSIDSNYDEAYLRCRNTGNAKITVRCKNASPLYIYVSVKDKGEDLKEIVVPSVIEIEESEGIKIEAAIKGLSDNEINKIEWISEDENIVEISGSGKAAMIKGIKSGFTYIKVRQKEISLEKKITCAVYEKGSPHLPLISLERSFYEIEKEGILSLKVIYGSNVPDQITESKLKWECEGEGIVSLVSNGRTCDIKAINEGVEKIRISGEGFYNKYEFTVCVKNGESAAYWYSFSSEKTKGIVKGNEEIIEVSILDEMGDKVNDCMSQIEYKIDGDDECIEVKQADNVFTIKGVKEGEAYIKLFHPMVKDTYRIYIYVRNTQEEIDSFYPLTTDRDHYLLNIGDKCTLNVITKDDSGNEKIKWSVNDAMPCSYSISEDKKSCSITARKAGECIFTVKHEDGNEIKFVIGVTEYDVNAGKKKIMTESIIGLCEGEEKNTEITTNLTESEISNLVWTSSDETIVEADGAGIKAVLKAKKKGIAEVKVKYSSSVYAVIVVYVEENESKVKSYKAMNIDQRYSVIRKDENLILTPFYGESIADSKKTKYTDILSNNVVEFENTGGKISIRGINEGIARIKVENENTNIFEIFIEVSGELEGNISDGDTGYLTVLKNVFRIYTKDAMKPLVFEVNPIGIEEKYYSTIRWSNSDNSVCTVSGTGKVCQVFANKEGTSEIKCSSVYSSNEIIIKIIVSGEEEVKTAYIKANRTVIEIDKGNTEEIECTVENSDYDITGFTVENSNNQCVWTEIKGNRISVKGIEKGQSVITIKYGNLDEIKCVVSVRGISEEIVYLTTDDNYSVIKTGETGKIKVNLVNYSETDMNKYIWNYADSDSQEIIKITGSGNEVLIKGLKEGIAGITVRHDKALYALNITVKVSESGDYLPVYIKPENNVITVKKGSRTNVKVNLVNGNENSENLFSWDDSGSTEILSVTGSGRDAIVTGIETGVGKIRVMHPDCIGQGGIDIIVIVEEINPEDMLYITCDNPIIEMNIMDEKRIVNVNLQGGNAYQNTLFKYELLSEESVEKNVDTQTKIATSKQVIDFNGLQDTLVINPKNEGIAYIRVKNEATEHFIDLKVIVNDNSVLSFEKKSLKIKEGESYTMNVTSPSSKTILYSTSDDRIANVYGTKKNCCIEAYEKGVCIIRVYTSDGKMEDELIVEVEKNPEKIPQYIWTDMSVMNLDCGNDTSGKKITAKVMGTEVETNASEQIKWDIKSGRSNIIKLGTIDKTSGTGKEMIILPVGQGTEEITLTYPKINGISKVIYITVTQGNVQLKINVPSVVMNRNEGYSLNASLTGIEAGQENEIVWTTGDSSIVCFKDIEGSGEEKNSVKGSTCYFQSKKICEDGVVVTCKYRDLVDTCRVFVKEVPGLHIAVSSDTIRYGQAKYYNINLTPESALDNLTMDAYDSTFLSTETCLVKKEEEIKGTIPEGITVPYIKVVGGNAEGITKLCVKCDNLTSVLSIKTTNAASILWGRYEYKREGKVTAGNIGTVLNVPYDVSELKVYFTRNPGDLDLNIDHIKEYDSTCMLKSNWNIKRNNIPKFLSTMYGGNGEAMAKVEKGKDALGEYIKFIPEGYDLYFPFVVVPMDNENGYVELKLCFYDNEAFSKIKINYSNERIEGTKNKNTIDIENGIIHLNTSIIYKLKLEIKGEGKTYIAKEKGKWNKNGNQNITVNETFDTFQCMKTKPNTGEAVIRQEYAGYYTVRAEYITGYETWGTWEKTFVVFLDEMI